MCRVEWLVFCSPLNIQNDKMQEMENSSARLIRKHPSLSAAESAGRVNYVQTQQEVQKVTCSLRLANEPVPPLTQILGYKKFVWIQPMEIICCRQVSWIMDALPRYLGIYGALIFYNNETFYGCWSYALIFSCHFLPTWIVLFPT